MIKMCMLNSMNLTSLLNFLLFAVQLSVSSLPIAIVAGTFFWLCVFRIFFSIHHPWRYLWGCWGTADAQSSSMSFLFCISLGMIEPLVCPGSRVFQKIKKCLNTASQVFNGLIWVFWDTRKKFRNFPSQTQLWPIILNIQRKFWKIQRKN